MSYLNVGIKYFTALVLLFLYNRNILASDIEDDLEKLKQFEKHMGKPNIYLNKDAHLVLLVTVYKGDANRVIDSGLISVGIQLKDTESNDANSNLVNYLSHVLKIREELFSIAQGNQTHTKIVTIHDDKVMLYKVVDKLVAALEETAKEDPSALRKIYPGSSKIKETEMNISSEDSSRGFEWREGMFEQV